MTRSRNSTSDPPGGKGGRLLLHLGPGSGRRSRATTSTSSRPRATTRRCGREPRLHFKSSVFGGKKGGTRVCRDASGLQCCCCSLPRRAPSQRRHRRPERPAPERRVPFFAGEWNFTGELDGVRFGPDQPENRVTEHCEMLGDFFLTCRYELRRSASSLKGLGIFGYDKAAEAYFFTSYDNTRLVDR